MANNQPFKKNKLVDFNSLSPRELRDLERKWSNDAMKFEIRLEAAVRQNKPSKDIDKLMDSANKLWRRVRAINRHLNK